MFCFISKNLLYFIGNHLYKATLVLIATSNNIKYMNITFFFILSIVVCGLTIKFRPYLHIKTNIIEIINCIFFIILIFLLYIWNSKGTWNYAKQFVYIGIMIGGNACATAISLHNMYKALFTSSNILKLDIKSHKVKPKEHNKNDIQKKENNIIKPKNPKHNDLTGINNSAIELQNNPETEIDKKSGKGIIYMRDEYKLKRNFFMRDDEQPQSQVS